MWSWCTVREIRCQPVLLITFLILYVTGFLFRIVQPWVYCTAGVEMSGTAIASQLAPQFFRIAIQNFSCVAVTAMHKNKCVAYFIKKFHRYFVHCWACKLYLNSPTARFTPKRLLTPIFSQSPNKRSLSVIPGECSTKKTSLEGDWVTNFDQKCFLNTYLSLFSVLAEITLSQHKDFVKKIDSKSYANSDLWRNLCNAIFLTTSSPV